MAAVGVAEIRAEGGDFDFEGIAAEEHDAELRADVEAIGEELENFGWCSVRGDVVIEGNALEQQIADAASGQQGLVAMALESFADRVGQVAGIHGMIMRLEVESCVVLRIEARFGGLRAAKDETGDVVGLAGGADEIFHTFHEEL